MRGRPVAGSRRPRSVGMRSVGRVRPTPALSTLRGTLELSLTSEVSDGRTIHHTGLTRSAARLDRYCTRDSLRSRLSFPSTDDSCRRPDGTGTCTVSARTVCDVLLVIRFLVDLDDLHEPPTRTAGSTSRIALRGSIGSIGYNPQSSTDAGSVFRRLSCYISMVSMALATARSSPFFSSSR